jgi:hypothetical protein
MAIAELVLPSRRVGILHVAVLECERMPENIVQSHGHFADIFNRWLQTGIGKVNFKRPAQKRTAINVSRWAALDGIYPGDITGIDAFIITGSVHSAYDNFPWIRALEGFIRGA